MDQKLESTVEQTERELKKAGRKNIGYSLMKYGCGTMAVVLVGLEIAKISVGIEMDRWTLHNGFFACYNAVVACYGHVCLNDAKENINNLERELEEIKSSTKY